MLGLIGISYLLSALTLVFTKTASFTTIFSYLLLFFSGVAEGVGERGAAYYLLPLSQGIDISRRIILKLDVTVLDIGLLVFNTIVYLLLGIVVFHSIMKSGRKKGISMEY
jgi:ABC-2 type transport system permease protein